MRILVTGGSGQLGHDVVIELKKRGHTPLSPSHTELDITDESAVSNFFLRNSPEAVIHCAAYTAVDRAETEQMLCRKTNIGGTKNITEQCIILDIPEIFISTDYVFDGGGTAPWSVNDQTSPINVYGKSKADAETIVQRNSKHFIVRISWVFGIVGNNFVKTMIKLSEKMTKINVVSDQIGSPTYTCDLAPLLCDMITTDKYGIYHAHNDGYCSWYNFACHIFNSANLRVDVSPIKTTEYPTAAKRPLNSKMDTSSLTIAGFTLLPDWKDAVNRYVE